MRRPHLLLAVGTIGLSFLVSACGGSSGPTTVGTISTDPTVQDGYELVRGNSCLGCHTIDGSKSSGPTFKGLAGSTVTLSDGRQVTADASYLARAISDPDAEIAKGFPKGVMATVMGNRKKLTDEEVADMVAYLQSIH